MKDVCDGCYLSASAATAALARLEPSHAVVEQARELVEDFENGLTVRAPVLRRHVEKIKALLAALDLAKPS